MGVRQLFLEEGTPAELSEEEEEEEMHTPREVRETTRAATRARTALKKRIIVGRPRQIKRTAPGRPPRRARRTSAKEETLLDLTKEISTSRTAPTVVKISTPQAGDIVPPMMGALHWNDEEEITNTPITPIAHLPPSSASQSEPTPYHYSKEVENLQAELRELKLMMQEQARRGENPPRRPTADYGDTKAKLPDANAIQDLYQPRMPDPWLDGEIRKTTQEENDALADQ